MSTALESRPIVSAELQEKVLLGGDLKNLSVAERLAYYNNICLSLDLNPLTRPFEYLNLSGKIVLYARKDCTEQLRTKRHVSVRIVSREVVEGIYVVTAQASMQDDSAPDGIRFDESIGAVPIDKLMGEARTNALMKGETKAKRRVTLSICGLGMLDETEVDSIPGAKVVEAEGKTFAEKFPEQAKAIEHKLAPQGSVIEPGVDEVMQDIAQADPAAPYRAKILTAHDEQEVTAAYHATPDALKQECYGDYTKKLKAFAAMKGGKK